MIITIMKAYLAIIEASLRFDHGDDLEPPKVDLEVLVDSLRDPGLRTPCPTLDSTPNPEDRTDRFREGHDAWKNMEDESGWTPKDRKTDTDVE